MDVIQKAVDTLKFTIPRPILETVFIKRGAGIGSWRDDIYGYRRENANIDQLIIDTVIRPRVCVDCNLVGGTEAFIPLAGLPVERANDYTSVYRIPKDKTQGRSILTALSISFTDPSRISSYGVATSTNNNAVMRAGQAVMDAMGTIPAVSTAHVQLIGENVVMVRDVIVLPANVYLRCVLANDENLTHIQPRSYRHFAKLVEHAVKAYIYNEYVIQMDLGELHGGQTLGRFKEIIDTYSDANELYETYLNETWQKVALMNDRESWTRNIRMRIGAYR